jgi:hypothetical protein
MQSKTLLTVLCATVLTVALLKCVTSEQSSLPVQDCLPAAQLQATAGRPELQQPAAVEHDAHMLDVLGARGESRAAPSIDRQIVAEACSSEEQARSADENSVRRRASAAAKQLKLSSDAEDALLAVLMQEQARRSVAFRDLRREPDQAETRAQVRGELDDILAWKIQELRTRFGRESAGVIMKRR